MVVVLTIIDIFSYFPLICHFINFENFIKDNSEEKRTKQKTSI